MVVALRRAGFNSDKISSCHIHVTTQHDEKQAAKTHGEMTYPVNNREMDEWMDGWMDG